jgi:RimJ/RimL family protein N-acetyltransferase
MTGLKPDFPVTTRRLRLRPLREEDLPWLLAYHSSVDVHRFLPIGTMDATTILNRIATGPWSRSAIESEGDAMVLGVELSETGELVGDVMLAWGDGANRGGEVGYVFNPAFGGQGYATEAVREVLRLAFEELGLHRVIARIDSRNERSLRLAVRIGMRPEAHLVQSWWHHDEWADEVHLALLASEWSSGAAS